MRNLNRAIEAEGHTVHTATIIDFIGLCTNDRGSALDSMPQKDARQTIAILLINAKNALAKTIRYPVALKTKCKRKPKFHPIRGIAVLVGLTIKKIVVLVDATIALSDCSHVFCFSFRQGTC